MLDIWKLNPTGELDFSGHLISEPHDSFFRKEEVGPFRVHARWNPTAPSGIRGELFGDPKLGELLDLPRGELRIVGPRVRGEIVIKPVHLTRWVEQTSDGPGPIKVADFTAGDVYTESFSRTTRQLKPPSINFLLPNDPIWVPFMSLFGRDFEVKGPFLTWEHERGGVRIRTETLQLGGSLEIAASQAYARRLCMSLLATPNNRATRRLDLQALREKAEPLLNDVLLLSGFVAGRPAHALGGSGYAIVAADEGNMLHCVDFTCDRVRFEAEHGGSYSRVKLEPKAVHAFLTTGMKELETAKRAAQLRLALQGYLASLYPAFSAQRFLMLCTAIEALREWHTRIRKWDPLVSGESRSVMEEQVEQALIATAREGHLPAFAHSEARKKIGELFRPTIQTVLDDLVKLYEVKTDDLFYRSPTTGKVKYDFLKARNDLVHQGKEPEPHTLANVNTRARYFFERLMFSILGYRGRLRDQHPVAKPEAKSPG